MTTCKVIGATARPAQIKRLFLFLVAMAGSLGAAALVPERAMAQPAGTVCGDTFDDLNGFDNTSRFSAPLQRIIDLAVANCSSNTVAESTYNGSNNFVGPDTLEVINNVFQTDLGFTAGISVAAGVNVTNLLLDGAPYISGTQIPLDVAGAFNGTFQFDFGGNSFQFTVVKAAGSRRVQGFTIEALAGPATDAEFVRTRTLRVIGNFLANRADQLTANDPDIAGRLIGGFGGANGLPADISANGQNGSVNVTVSSSLRQVAAADDAAPPVGAPTSTEPLSGFDVWIQGTWSRISSGNADSDLALLHIGADYRFSDNFLVGLLGQLDWSDEENSTLNTEVDGFGWMIGPYAAARLHEHLVFDARAAWGQSDNDVSPFGTYTDSFDTDRWLIRGGLTGDIHLDDWHLTPGLSILYFEEQQHSYTDSLGIEIPEQTVSLGRLMFGPEVAYLYRPSPDWQVRPQFGFEGIWDFSEAQVVDVSTGIAGGAGGLRGRAAAGLSIIYDDRYTLTGEGFYDGIGAGDFDAFGGSLGINVLIVDGVSVSGEGFRSGSRADADYGGNLRLRLQLN